MVEQRLSTFCCCDGSLFRATQISKEIQDQNTMLGEVEGEFEDAIHGMNLVTRKTKELIKRSGGSR